MGEIPATRVVEMHQKSCVCDCLVRQLSLGFVKTMIPQKEKRILEEEDEAFGYERRKICVL